MPFSAQVNGITDLIARLEDARNAIGPGMELGIENAANYTVAQTHDASPVDYEANNGVIPGEEGHLDESFYADPVEGTGTGAQTYVKTTEPIKFSYVTQGTLDKEPIEPLIKQALWWPGAPHPLSSVHGQAANPFTDPIADEVAAKGYDFFKPVLDAIAQALQG